MPLAHDQRYCLGCGTRIGSRSPQLEQLLWHVSSWDSPRAVVEARAASAPTAADVPRVAGGLRLPAARVSALLVLLFLGFGVLLGNAAGSRVSDTLASVRSPLRVELPAAGAASGVSSTPTAESSPAGEASEPPAAESEATPSPSSVPATTTTAAATAPPGAGGSPGSHRPSGSHGGSTAGGGGPAKKLPPVKHVFVIMLSDEPYASVFGPSSTAPYLSGTLEHEGELLVRYDAVAHEELANEVALISGQGPTAETAANCPTYTAIASPSVGESEQVLGSGCVYPSFTQTLAGELVAKHLTWRAYLQGTEEAGTQADACAHPVLGQVDPTAAQASSSGSYATFRNPFVYFDSILGTPECAADDVGLETLKSDLGAANRTRNFSYIVPDRCHDGNPTPCTPGAPAGMAQTSAFLKEVVPEITGSKAYKESGLLAITVDQAPSSGALADSSSCCGQPLFPNAPAKTLAGVPRGGGTVGALLLSPYVKPGGTNAEPFNHFSLLRTIEDLFGLQHLGYAGLPAVKSFEPAMFTASKG